MSFKADLYGKSFLTDRGRVLRYEDAVKIMNQVKAQTLRFGLELDYLKHPTPRTEKALEYILKNIDTNFGIDEEIKELEDDMPSIEHNSERIPDYNNPLAIKGEPSALDEALTKKQPDFNQFVPAKNIISSEEARTRNLKPLNLIKEKPERQKGSWRKLVDYLRTLEIGRIYLNAQLANYVDIGGSLSAYKSFLITQGYLEPAAQKSFRVVKEIPADVKANSKVKEEVTLAPLDNKDACDDCGQFFLPGESHNCKDNLFLYGA